MEHKTRYEALLECEEKAGSKSQMARDLGVPQPTLSRWFTQSKQLPPIYVLRAEALYGVSRHHLRPDIYPVEIPPRFYGVDGGMPHVTRDISTVQHRHDAPANRKQGRAA